MNITWIRPVAAVWAVIAGLQWASTASAGEAEGYSLLRLKGTWVKWGEPALGLRAEVTYALASASKDFPGARNCRALEPVGPMLARSGIDDGAFRKELDLAFREWSRIANIAFTPVEDTEAANIVIGAQRHPRGWAYSNVAFAPGRHNGTRRISRSLICLNPARKWKVGFDGDLDVYDLRYTLIHEIGHAIGLDHPGPEGQLMSFRYHEDFRNPQAGDVAGAAILYGAAGGSAEMAPRHAAANPASGVRKSAQSAPRDLSLGQR